MEKEEIEVIPDELDSKVEELTHQSDVRKIVVMDDLGEYVMETTVTPPGTETKRFSTLREFSPRHYTIIVERRYA